MNDAAAAARLNDYLSERTEWPTVRQAAQDAVNALNRILDLIPHSSSTGRMSNTLNRALRVCEDLVNPVS